MFSCALVVAAPRWRQNATDVGAEPTAKAKAKNQTAQANPQLAAISVSSGEEDCPPDNFRSAKTPIIAALSVHRLLSASRKSSPAFWHASASSLRSARLHVTPPDAVTQATFNRPAARTVLVTSTSTMAACTLAHRSRRRWPS